ncbi:hypothetical protein AB0E69_26605 [Kribbella sp. NPDC026611]|uniref:hypothetical protein n=1 Tax=Kribbella sp. NPDC026611 TaxID=3154911 RepID=UPI0033D1B5E0
MVVQWKFGQTDHEIPVPPARVVLQPGHGAVDVFGAGGERLTHHGDVPTVLTVEWAQIGQSLGDLGGRGRISHQTNANGSHCNPVPVTASTTPCD